MRQLEGNHCGGAAHVNFAKNVVRDWCTGFLHQTPPSHTYSSLSTPFSHTNSLSSPPSITHAHFLAHTPLSLYFSLSYNHTPSPSHIHKHTLTHVPHPFLSPHSYTHKCLSRKHSPSLTHTHASIPQTKERRRQHLFSVESLMSQYESSKTCPYKFKGQGVGALASPAKRVSSQSRATCNEGMEEVM
jgi:hypothetical protein